MSEERQHRNRECGDDQAEEEEFSAPPIVVVYHHPDTAPARSHGDDDDASTLGAPSVDWQIDDAVAGCRAFRVRQPRPELAAFAECPTREENRARRDADLLLRMERAEERLHRLQQQQQKQKQHEGAAEEEEAHQEDEAAARARSGSKFLLGIAVEDDSSSLLDDPLFPSPIGVVEELLLRQQPRHRGLRTAANSHHQEEPPRQLQGEPPSPSSFRPPWWRISDTKSGGAFESFGGGGCGSCYYPASAAAADVIAAAEGPANSTIARPAPQLRTLYSTSRNALPLPYYAATMPAETETLPTMMTTTSLPSWDATTAAASPPPPQQTFCWMSHLQRTAAEGQSWLLLRQKSDEGRELRSQLERVLEEVRTLRVDNARLQDRVARQEERMKIELELLHLSLASCTCSSAVAADRRKQKGSSKLLRDGAPGRTGSPRQQQKQKPPRVQRTRNRSDYPSTEFPLNGVDLTAVAATKRKTTTTARSKATSACTNTLAIPTADDDDDRGQSTGEMLRLVPGGEGTSYALFDGAKQSRRREGRGWKPTSSSPSPSDWFPEWSFESLFAERKVKGDRTFPLPDDNDSNCVPFCLGDGAQTSSTVTTTVTGRDSAETGSSSGTNFRQGVALAVASFSSPEGKDIDWDKCHPSGFPV
jgi:hypothetical protein